MILYLLIAATQPIVLQGQSLGKNSYAAIDSLINAAFSASYSAPLESFELANEALGLAKANNYTKGIANAYMLLGIFYNGVNLYPVSAEHMLLAKQYADQAGDKALMKNVMHNLSGVYYTMGELDSALAALKTGFTSVQDSHAIGEQLNHYLGLTLIYQRLGAIDSALAAIQRAETVADADTSRRRKVLLELYTARILNEKGMVDSAISLTSAVIDQLPENDDNNYRLEAYLQLASLLEKQTRYNTALSVTDELLEIARAKGFTNYEESAWAQRAEILAAMGQWESAYSAQITYDSLMQRRKQDADAVQAENARMLYQLKNSQARVIEREAALASSNASLRLLLAITIFSITLVLLIVLFLRHTKKSERAIKARNDALRKQNKELNTLRQQLEDQVSARTMKVKEQRDRIFQFAHLNAHELRGKVANLIGLANLAYNKTDEERIHDIASRVRQSATEVDQIIRKLNQIVEEEEAKDSE